MLRNHVGRHVCRRCPGRGFATKPRVIRRAKPALDPIFAPDEPDEYAPPPPPPPPPPVPAPAVTLGPLVRRRRPGRPTVPKEPGDSTEEAPKSRGRKRKVSKRQRNDLPPGTKQPPPVKKSPTLMDRAKAFTSAGFAALRMFVAPRTTKEDAPSVPVEPEPESETAKEQASVSAVTAKKWRAPKLPSPAAPTESAPLQPPEPDIYPQEEQQMRRIVLASNRNARFDSSELSEEEKARVKVEKRKWLWKDVEGADPESDAPGAKSKLLRAIRPQMVWPCDEPVTSSGQYQVVCSYNYFPPNRAGQYRIRVPGCAPIYTERKLPFWVDEDSDHGGQYIIPSTSPTIVFDRVLRATSFMRPDFVFDDVHVVTTRNVLGTLLSFLANDDPCFGATRFNLQMVNDTLFIKLPQRESRPWTITRSYGLNFEKSVTRPVADSLNSTGHTRTILYKMGSVNCVVQSEIDATAGVDPESRQDISYTEKSKKDDLIVEVDNEMGRNAIPAAAAMELKTRSVLPGEVDTFWDSTMRQAWLGRTPNLVIGWHSGRLFSALERYDAVSEATEWERRNQGSLRKLAQLLRTLHTTVKKRNKGRDSIAILPMGGAVLRIYDSMRQELPVSEDLVQQCWSPLARDRKAKIAAREAREARPEEASSSRRARRRPRTAESARGLDKAGFGSASNEAEAPQRHKRYPARPARQFGKTTPPPRNKPSPRRRHPRAQHAEATQSSPPQETAAVSSAGQGGKPGARPGAGKHHEQASIHRQFVSTTRTEVQSTSSQEVKVTTTRVVETTTHEDGGKKTTVVEDRTSTERESKVTKRKKKPPKSTKKDARKDTKDVAEKTAKQSSPEMVED